LILFLFSDSGKSALKCLILSDSIAKYVSEIRDASVVSFSGINIVRLTKEIQWGQIDINAKNVIIHVGTNDINSSDVGAIMSSFNNLISVIRQSSKANIVISGILPRPVDWDRSNDKVKAINKLLVGLCKDRKIRFVHTYKVFLHEGKPKRELFAVRDGGLHLNLEGSRLLEKFFVNVVAHM